MRAPIVVACLACLAAIGCRSSRDAPVRPFGGRFYTSGTGVRVICSKLADANHEWKPEVLTASIAYAHDRRSVLHTFAPGAKVDLEALAPEFDFAAAYGVPMVTYQELATHHGAGWAFSIDDDDVDTWYRWRDFLRRHHVRLTFFVTRFGKLTDEQRRELRELVADGHDVEAQGVTHQAAPELVKARGLGRYVADEAVASREALRAEGYPVTAFAYPYGVHTAEIDEAMLREFAWLRTTGADNCLK
jgi:hypothetical protein